MSNLTQFTTGGRETAEEITSGSGNWAVPPGISWVRVFLVGGGGGGGSGGFATAPPYGGGGGGGGGGMILYADVPVTPGGTVPYTVGAGGVAGAAQPVSPTAPASGGAGGNTSFGSFTAYGGGGGARGTPTAVGDGGNGARGINFFGTGPLGWVGNLRFSEAAGGAPGGNIAPVVNRRGGSTSFSLGGQTTQSPIISPSVISPTGYGGGGGAGYINPASPQSGGFGANTTVNATDGAYGGGGGGGANRTPTNPLGGGSSAGAVGGNGYILITYTR